MSDFFTKAKDALFAAGKKIGEGVLDGLKFRSWWKSAAVYGGAALAGLGAACAIKEGIIRANMKSFEGSVVLITGGASGIGKLLAKLFLDEGATVVIWDVNYDKTAETVGEFRAETIEGSEGKKKYTGRIFGYRVDVSSVEKVQTAAEEMSRRIKKPVDVLINNAGVISRLPFLECAEKDIRQVMNVNTMSHFWTIRQFLPSMIANGRGHIVTICSLAGIAGVSGLASYSASKAAVFGLTESVRLDMKRRKTGVDTLIVCPYYTTGPLFAGVKSPIVKLLNPEDVARRIFRSMKRREEFVCIPDWMRVLNYSLRLFASASTSDWIQGALKVTESMDAVVVSPEAQQIEDEPAKPL